MKNARRTLAATCSIVALSASLAALGAAPAFAVDYTTLDPTAYTSLGTLTVNNGQTLSINTTTGTYSISGGGASGTGTTQAQSGGATIAVFDFSNINIASGATISVSGTAPLALLSRGTATIASGITITGSAGGGGQGGQFGSGGAAGTGGGGVGTFNQAGSGGGGAGANGGASGGGNAGGSAASNIASTFLAGGGGGGGGGAGSHGGAGGGAIEIIAVGNVSIGAVNVSGNAGTSSFDSNHTNGGGGGGGGGTIVVGSVNGSVTNAGTLSANGNDGAINTAGNTSSGGGGGGGGKIVAIHSGNYTVGDSSVGGISLITSKGNGASSTSGTAGSNGTAGQVYIVPDSIEVGNGQNLTVQTQQLFTTETVTGSLINNSVNNLTIDAGGTATATEVSILNNVTNNGTLNYNVASHATSAATIGGSGTLAIGGTATLTLTGTNTYSGGTTVSSGTLSLGSNGAAGTGAITTTDDPVIDYANGVTIANALVLGATTTQLQVLTGTATESGIISETGGAHGFEKIGAGTLVLTGVSTYTGTTTISGGTLSVSAFYNLGTRFGDAVILNGGTLAINADEFNTDKQITLNNVANNVIDNGGFDHTFITGSIQGTGGITYNGSGTIELGGIAANTYSGDTHVNNGTVIYVRADAFGTGTITLNNGTISAGAASVDLANNIVSSSGANHNTLAFTAAGDNTISGTISGSNALWLNGAASSNNITLSGNNSGFSGQLWVFGNETSPGAFSTTLNVSNANNIGTGQLELWNSGLQANANLTLANNVQLWENGALINTNWNNVTLNGVVSNSGPLYVKGGGTLVLSGDNTYSGGTILNNAVLSISADNNLGTGDVTFNGGLLLTTADVASAKNIVLTGAGTIGTDGHNDTFSGIISGSGLLIKDDAGTLTLSGDNTNSGGIRLVNGTLSLQSDHAAGTGTITSYPAIDPVIDYGAGVTIANAIVLENDTTQLQVLTGSATQSGVISNSGGAHGFEKTGAGTLVLTGNNTYTGGTTISGGVLSISADNNLGAGSTIALNGGTLQTTADVTSAKNVTVTNDSTIDTGSNNVAVNGLVQGSGTLEKNGTGMLTLNGVSTQSVATTLVNAGTLAIGDASHNTANYISTITVESGATLIGHGTVVGNVTSMAGGRVSPGGTIGTLNVIGNYTQAAGSTLSIEASPTANSVLNVSGTATLAGALQIVFDPGTYTARRINYLTANAISGRFTSVSAVDLPAGFNFTEGFNATTGFLDFVKIAVPTPTNATIYTAATTTQVDATQRANDGVLDRLDEVAEQGPGKLAAQSIAGESVQASSIAAPENFSGFNNLVGSLPDALAGYGGWFKASGNFASVGNGGSATGFNSETGGFMAGFDRAITGNIAAGMAAGYDHSNITEHGGGHASLDTARFSLYGSTKVESFVLGGALGYAHGWVDASRFVTAAASNAKGITDQNALSAALQASTHENVGRFHITPKIGMEYAHLFEDGFTETGATGFNFQAHTRNTDSLRPFIGASASTRVLLDDGLALTPETRIKYAHELFTPSRQSSVNVNGTDFILQGVNPSVDILSLGAGFKAKLDDAVDMFGDYDVDFRTGTSFDQTFSAGVKIKF